MSKKTGMVAGGKYKKNGTIVLKNGQVITSQDLLLARKAGIKPEQLSAYLEQKALQEKSTTVEKPAFGSHFLKDGPADIQYGSKADSTWVGIPVEEIQGYTNQIKKKHIPWYKKLFSKGGGK